MSTEHSQLKVHEKNLKIYHNNKQANHFISIYYLQLRATPTNFRTAQSMIYYYILIWSEIKEKVPNYYYNCR